MTEYGTTLSLNDRITPVLNNILNSTNKTTGAVRQLQSVLSSDIGGSSGFSAAAQAANETERAAEETTAEYKKMRTEVDGAGRRIRENTSAQKTFNSSLEAGNQAAAGLAVGISKIVRAYMAVAGFRQVFEFGKSAFEAYSDQLNSSVQLKSVLANMLDSDYVATFQVEADTQNAQARIDALKNGIAEPVTVTAGTLALDASFDQIAKKAQEIQAQGIYGDETMIAAGAEFATYFSDTNAVTAMMDTLSDYAIGMRGVTALNGEQMTDLATGLGKIMTGSYEAMTKKGFEFSDVQKAIIEGTATNAQITAQLGSEYVGLSQDMQAVAAITQVIDEAWGGLYENMSNTPQGKIIQLQNILGDMKETVGEGIAPYVMQIVNTILEHKEQIQQIVQHVTERLQGLLTIAEIVIEFAMNIVDNWDKIRPVVLGIAGAVGALAVALGIATVAQHLMNSAMLASPVTWIIIAVVAVIALILVAVKRILEATGVIDGSIGDLVGAVFVAGAAVVNFVIGIVNFVIQTLWTNFVEPFIGIVEWILNACNGGFDSFGDAVKNLIGNIISWFLSLGKVVTQIIDAIFGTNWTAGLNALQNEVLSWGKNENAITISREAPTIDYRIDYKDAWNSGVDVGNKLDNALKGFDSGLSISATEDKLGSIDANTSEINNSVSSRGEDELKYLRMLAERETINRYTTAQINLEMHSEATINSDTDIDGYFNELTEELRDQLLVTAEGLQS